MVLTGTRKRISKRKTWFREAALGSCCHNTYRPFHFHVYSVAISSLKHETLTFSCQFDVVA